MELFMVRDDPLLDDHEQASLPYCRPSRPLESFLPPRRRSISSTPLCIRPPKQRSRPHSSSRRRLRPTTRPSRWRSRRGSCGVPKGLQRSSTYSTRKLCTRWAMDRTRRRAYSRSRRRGRPSSLHGSRETFPPNSEFCCVPVYDLILMNGPATRGGLSMMSRVSCRRRGSQFELRCGRVRTSPILGQL